MSTSAQVKKTSATHVPPASAQSASWFYFVLFLVFVMLRLIPILSIDLVPTSDAAWYYQKAIEISQGEGYKRGDEFTAFWPVGYPAFLAALFYVFQPAVPVGQIANLLLACVSLVLVIKIARTLTQDESITRLTALLFTFYPNSIAYSSILLSETLFTALLLLACWLYIRKDTFSHGALSGAVFGLATLVKSQTLVIPLALALLSLVAASGPRFKLTAMLRVVVLYAALFAILAPWTIRNYVTFGEVVLVSSNGGISMLAGNNPSMVPDFKTDFVMDDALVKSVGHPENPELQVDKEAKRKALGWISENPGQFLALVPHKVWRLWAPDGEAEWAYQSGSEAYTKSQNWFRAARLLNQAYYSLMIVLALAFPVLYLKRHAQSGSHWIWLGYLLALLTTAISVAFSGQSRYHYPIIPFLMINAAWVVVHFRTEFLASRQTS